MSVLDTIKEGDKIVYGRSSNSFIKATVTKVLKTRITVDCGTQFNRRTGVRIGDGDSWTNKTQILVEGGSGIYYGWNKPLLTWEQADIIMAGAQLERERYFLAKKITDAKTKDLALLPLETLKEAIKLLGLENDKT